MWRDKAFHAALLAAPAFWVALLYFIPVKTDWWWPVNYPVSYLTPALIYPVLEEIVFRGLIQELVYQHITKSMAGPLSVANIITSVLFTALHFIYHPPLWAALVFIQSLVFGFFKDRYQTLTAPVILHVFYNAGYLWLFSGPK